MPTAVFPLFFPPSLIIHRKAISLGDNEERKDGKDIKSSVFSFKMIQILGLFCTL